MQQDGLCLPGSVFTAALLMRAALNITLETLAPCAVSDCYLVLTTGWIIVSGLRGRMYSENKFLYPEAGASPGRSVKETTCG